MRMGGEDGGGDGDGGQWTVDGGEGGTVVMLKCSPHSRTGHHKDQFMSQALQR